MRGGSGVLVLPCGAGKTVIGLGVMARAACHTLILCTSITAIRQWQQELRTRTTVDPDAIGEYTGERKEIRPITLATYQVMTTRSKGRNGHQDEFPHLDLFMRQDWGLIVYDEVHLLPAPVFRVTAEIQSRRRLGLTATLIREDGREEDVFSLIGPKKFDAPWKDLESQGWIAPAICTEVRVPMSRERRLEYASAEKRQQYRVAATSPTKLLAMQALLERHRQDRVLVIGQYLDQLDEVGRAAGRAADHRQDAGPRAREAVRRLPERGDHAAGRLEGRELRDRPARGERRHRAVRDVRIAAGGGPAARADPAPEGGRRPGLLLRRGQPRHGRPDLLRPPPAVPDRAGLPLRDRGLHPRPRPRRDTLSAPRRAGMHSGDPISGVECSAAAIRTSLLVPDPAVA